MNPDDQAIYTCKAEAVGAIKNLNEGEGSESWWGWWKVPRGWRGTSSWGMLFEFIPADHVRWPSYSNINFDAAKRDSLRGMTPRKTIRLISC